MSLPARNIFSPDAVVAVLMVDGGLDGVSC